MLHTMHTISSLLLLFVVVGNSSVIGRNSSLVETGGTAVLKCPLRNENSSIQWLHLASNEIYFDGIKRNPKLENKTRFQIIGDHNVGEFFLQIKQVDETDQGIYRCDVVIKNRKTSASVTLTVYENRTNSTTTDTSSTPKEERDTGFSLIQAMVIYTLAVCVVIMLPVIVAVAVKQTRVPIYSIKKERKQNLPTVEVTEYNAAYETINEEEHIPLDVVSEPSEQNASYLDCVVGTPSDSVTSNEDDRPGLTHGDIVYHKPYNCLQDNWQQMSTQYDICSLST